MCRTNNTLDLHKVRYVDKIFSIFRTSTLSPVTILKALREEDLLVLSSFLIENPRQSIRDSPRNTRPVTGRVQTAARPSDPSSSFRVSGHSVFVLWSGHNNPPQTQNFILSQTQRPKLRTKQGRWHRGPSGRMRLAAGISGPRTSSLSTPPLWTPFPRHSANTSSLGCVTAPLPSSYGDPGWIECPR